MTEAAALASGKWFGKVCHTPSCRHFPPAWHVACRCVAHAQLPSARAALASASSSYLANACCPGKRLCGPPFTRSGALASLPPSQGVDVRASAFLAHHAGIAGPRTCLHPQRALSPCKRLGGIPCWHSRALQTPSQESQARTVLAAAWARASGSLIVWPARLKPSMAAAAGRQERSGPGGGRHDAPCAQHCQDGWCAAACMFVHPRSQAGSRAPTLTAGTISGLPSSMRCEEPWLTKLCTHCAGVVVIGEGEKDEVRAACTVL